MSMKMKILKTMIGFKPFKTKRMSMIASIYAILKPDLPYDIDEIKRINTIMQLSHSYKALKFPMDSKEEIWSDNTDYEKVKTVIHELKDNINQDRLDRLWSLIPRWLRYSYSETEKDIRTLLSIMYPPEKVVKA